MYKVTTVRIREDLYQEAKRRKIVLSKILEESLQKILEEEREKERKALKRQVVKALKKISRDTAREALEELRA